MGERARGVPGADGRGKGPGAGHTRRRFRGSRPRSPVGPVVAAAVPLPSPVLQPCRTDSSREEVTKKEMLAQAMEFKQKEVALLEKMEGMQEEAMTAAKRAENALALKEEELAKTLVLLEHERTLIEQLKEDFQSQFDDSKRLIAELEREKGKKWQSSSSRREVAELERLRACTSSS